MSRLILLSLMLAFGASASAQTLVSYYDFNTAAGTAPVLYPSPISPTTGAGSITHTFTAVASFAGSTINAQGTSDSGGSFSPQGGVTTGTTENNGAYLQVNFATTGLENPVLAFAVRGTSTGFNSATVSYSVDGGATFTPFPAGGFAGQNQTAFSLQTIDLAAANAVDNKADVRVRITLDGATSAGGNNRYDNLTVNATPLGGAVESASVTFNPTSASTAENVPYTAGTIVYALANADANPANNPAASGTVTITSGNAAQIQTFTATYSFPVGTAPGATVAFTATPVNDNTFTGTRTVVFGFGTPTAGTATGTFTLTITDDEAAPPTPPVVINELDSDQTGTDTAEFIELLGPPNTSLTGLVLVTINGANNTAYGTYDLAGFTTNAAGLFVIGNAGVTPAPGLILPANGLQNGPDAVALYAGSAASAPTTATTANLVDAVVYGVNNPPEAALLTALGLPATYQFEENYEGMKDTQSLARLNVTTPGGVVPSALLYVQAPSPGALNGGTVTVNETAGVDDVAGYRLLGFPVVRPTTQPFQVADLAPINLVQGVPAGAANPAQYPQAPQNANGIRANVFPTYRAGAAPSPYLAPSSTDVGLPPAAGFFWYFYDQDIPRANIPAVFGPGTSQSFDLANPAFQLTATGIAVDDRLNGTATPGPFAVTIPVSPDGLYMAANPFAYPVLLSGIQASSGTVGTAFQVYDPVMGFMVASTPTVSPWQGVFVTITGATGTDVTLSTSSRNVVPTSPVALVGRTAEPRLALVLSGTLASGASVTDHAAIVRLLDDATTEWDRHDAAKLTPPQEAFALIAPVGTHDGAAVRQAVLSLPTEAETTTPLAFRATEAGTFSLAWDAEALPAGLQVSLRDMATGTVLDLRSATGYAFTAEAGDWANRFELVFGRGTVAGEDAPTAFALGNPAPNPASQRSALALRVDAAQHVTATVVDALGRTVATVYDADLAAGAQAQIVVETGRLAPGVYVVRVQGETFAEARRMTVAR